MAERSAPIDIKSQPGFKTTAYICVFLLYAPIVMLMILSFNSGSATNKFEGLSLHWYRTALANDEFYSAAQNTITITVVATIISTVFATLAAIGTTRVKPWRGIGTAFMIINLPLMVPEIITMRIGT